MTLLTRTQVPPENSHPSHPIFSLSSCALAVFLGALDTYVIVSILTTIMSDMNISLNHINQLTPAITGYLLGYTVAMPLFGQSSDRFGRRIVLQIGLLIFIIGSTITAFSYNVPMLVVGRTIQGLAGGALLPISMALAADLWQNQNRATALGFIGGAQELGSVVGPLYGIYIAELMHSWRYIFWLNIPLAALSMVIIHYSVPSKQSSQESKIDFCGAILLATSLALIILGLYNPEDNGHILPPGGMWYLILAAVSGLGFFLWECKSSIRIIDPKKIIPAPFLSCLAVSLCIGSALMVTMVDTELFARGIGGLNQKASIWLLARFLIAIPIGAVLGGYLASRFQERIMIITGMIVSAIGYWRISEWNAHSLASSHFLGMTISLSTIDLFVTGLGIGIVIGPLASAILRSVSEEYHGISSAIIVAARTFGMLLGISCFTALGMYQFGQRMSHAPQLMVVPGQEIDYEAYFHQIHLYTLTALRAEYSETFLITAVICVIGALCAIGIRNDAKPIYPKYTQLR